MDRARGVGPWLEPRGPDAEREAREAFVEVEPREQPGVEGICKPTVGAALQRGFDGEQRPTKPTTDDRTQPTTFDARRSTGTGTTLCRC